MAEFFDDPELTRKTGEIIAEEKANTRMILKNTGKNFRQVCLIYAGVQEAITT